MEFPRRHLGKYVFSLLVNSSTSNLVKKEPKIFPGKDKQIKK